MISRTSSTPVREAASISTTSGCRSARIATQFGAHAARARAVGPPVPSGAHAVQAARQDARRGGLARAAHAREHEGVRHPSRAAKARRRMRTAASCPITSSKVSRPVLAGQHPIGRGRRDGAGRRRSARGRGRGRAGLRQGGAQPRRTGPDRRPAAPAARPGPGVRAGRGPACRAARCPARCLARCRARPCQAGAGRLPSASDGSPEDPGGVWRRDAVRGARRTTDPVTRLQACGLQAAGLQAAGQQAWGLQAAGLQVTGLR